MGRKWLAVALGMGLGAPLGSCTEEPYDPEAKSPPFYRFVGDWEQVIDVPFDSQKVAKMQIGGYSEKNNFANRGDVEVYFTEENRIRVLMRRIAVDDESEDYPMQVVSRIVPWAYAISAPKDPDDLSPSDMDKNCTTDAWLDGCMLLAYFEGAVQPAAVAADFRVYVPKDWDGDLTIVTEDFLHDGENFPKRADVKVKGFIGRVNVAAESGEIRLERNGDGPVALDCTAEQVAACNDVAWDLGSCMCKVFPRVDVETLGAANVFVNYSDRKMIGTAYGRNDDATLPQGNTTECKVEVACSEFENCEVLENPEPWQLREAINLANIANTSVGMGARVVVRRCEEVSFSDAQGETQSEGRGFVYFCGESGAVCSAIDVP
jgi:hypothetical protein